MLSLSEEQFTKSIRSSGVLLVGIEGLFDQSSACEEFNSPLLLRLVLVFTGIDGFQT